MMKMNSRTIRPVVICLFTNKDKILVFEGRDKSGEYFYRPLGGGIEFAEYSKDALIREIKEEIDADIDNINYLGTIEHIFTHNGKLNHEIFQVYDASFVDPTIYSLSSFEGIESDGESFKVLWKSTMEFRNGDSQLVPPELINFLPA
jgi:8-oxo-dGTP pyrophosphatase MutT (NUDIX family)